MRYIGILIMAGTLIGGGFLTAKNWQNQLELLLLLRQMVYHLKGQILSANATLPEALEEVGTRSLRERAGIFQEPGQFFCRVAKRLEARNTTSFAEIWTEEMKRIPKDFPVKKEEMEQFRALGEHLGYADRAMQERTMLFYLEQADDTIARRKGELQEKTKLCRCLGMAAGLFLMIVLA